MSWYLKTTTVSGYALDDDIRNADTRKYYALNGHWKRESVISFVKRRNIDIQSAEFQHHTSDMNGRGRGDRGEVQNLND